MAEIYASHIFSWMAFKSCIKEVNGRHFTVSVQLTWLITSTSSESFVTAADIVFHAHTITTRWPTYDYERIKKLSLVKCAIISSLTFNDINFLIPYKIYKSFPLERL